MADKKPLNDVVKSDKVPAGATSRPIITGHEMIKDPMVTAGAGTTPETSESSESVDPQSSQDTALRSPAPRKVIQPPETTPEKTTSKPVEGEKTDEPDETPPKEEADADDTAIDAVLEQVGDKQQESKEDEEARKRQELVDKLTEEKKYFLPINQVRKRRNNRIVLALFGIVLVLLLGLAAAADAGYIKPGFTLPFDFIKDKESPKVESPTPVQTPAAKQPATKTSVPIMKGVSDADTASWVPVISGKSGFTIKVPDGWEVTNYKQDNNIRGQNITYASGTLATVDTQDTVYSGDSIFRLNIVQFKNSDKFNWVNGTEQKQEFTSGTLKGTRYYKQYPVEPINGIGPLPGTESYTYEFKTQDTTTYVIYNIFNYNQYSKDAWPNFTKSDVNQLVTVEKMVKTLEITQ